MSKIEDALKLLTENGYAISVPETDIYLVDHGKGVPMTTRKTLKPHKGGFNKTPAQRVALIKLDELEWIEFKAVDHDKAQKQ